jgi:hypothetical protein
MALQNLIRPRRYLRKLYAILAILLVFAVCTLAPGDIIPIIANLDHHAIAAMAMTAGPMLERPRRYLRKNDVRIRYRWKAKISVDRAVKRKVLPPPDTYMGRDPLWGEDTLDAHDAANTQRPVPPKGWLDPAWLEKGRKVHQRKLKKARSARRHAEARS